MINRIKPITRHPRFITSVKRLTILVIVLAFIYGVSSAIIVGSSPESLGLPEFYTDNSNSVAYNNVAYVEDDPLDKHYLDIFVPQLEGPERFRRCSFGFTVGPGCSGRRPIFRPVW